MIEGIIALTGLGVLIAASWRYRRSISEVFALLRGTVASLILLGVAAVLYGAAQTREVLWINYRPDLAELIPQGNEGITPGDYVLFVRLLWETLYSPSTISILVLAFCFAVVNPDYHRIAWRKQREDGIDIRAAQTGGGVAAYLFLAIVFYNILVALNIEPAGAVEWVTFAVNVFFAFLVPGVLAGFLFGITDRPRPTQARCQTSIAPSLSELWWVIPLGASFSLPFALGLLSAFAICAAALALLLLSAPLKLVGVNLGAYFDDVIVILNLFLAALMILISLLGWVRARDKIPKFEKTRSVGTGALLGWPVLGVVLVIGFVLSLFNLNDNHQIRGECTKNPKPPVTLTAAYTDWIRLREKDLTAARPGLFPVYVVAAEGGGIYAAYHTALTLAAIQDRHSGFARHLFAISSVSGGSLGASVFSSLVAASKQPDQNWYWKKSIEVLDGDFLSGLTYAALFTDLAASLLPCVNNFCPGRELDRSRALEDSFDAAWRKSFPTGVNAELLQRPAAEWRADHPALLLNTTEVETGERVVIAPFTLSDPLTPALTPALSTLRERKPCLDVSVVTAAGLSARFPLLTPAGWYVPDGKQHKSRTKPVPDPKSLERNPMEPSRDDVEEAVKKSVMDELAKETEANREPAQPAPDSVDKLAKKKKAEADAVPARRRLVDGAYFDNSGIETALDVVLALQRAERQLSPDRERVRFILIVVKTIGEAPDESVQSALAELLAPVRTVDTVRSTRAESALLRATAAIDGIECATDIGKCPKVSRGPEIDCENEPKKCFAGRAVRVAPLVSSSRLPLGWMLSEKSKQAIKENDALNYCGHDNLDLAGGDLLPATLSPSQAKYHYCVLVRRIGEEMGVLKASPTAPLAQ